MSSPQGRPLARGGLPLVEGRAAAGLLAALITTGQRAAAPARPSAWSDGQADRSAWHKAVADVHAIARALGARPAGTGTRGR
ncbi:hypothetical protein [Streptomyces europaeiscabiei]|uniref:hypothetical protein n=1 Tax=Streptomyces europaeiscabiei TaxID=146819 RepID=UPI0038F631B4